MLTYTLRRLMVAVPTLLMISLMIFLLVDLAPGSPASEIPLTVPAEVKARMIEAMGINEPVHIRYLLWLKQFFWTEPLYAIDGTFGTAYADGAPRIISYSSKVPVMTYIAERLPQTLIVIGTAYLVAILIALPIGIYSAYRQYSWFDQLGTFVSMIGYSVPTFFTGLLAIIIFTQYFGWFPSIYNTSLEVVDWATFKQQVNQMFLPVMVLALFNAAELSRYTRSAMLENLSQDYARTARAKGMSEGTVVLKHVLRNSMIPVITVITLGLPAVFAGAIVTEQVFKINGIGAALIGAIQVNDLPVVQTIAFITAILIVLFNLVADILYGILDPRIRYD
jgi:peptide/nickel transport system permease protein